MLEGAEWVERYGGERQWDLQARRGARWYSMLEFARRVGAMETAFDLLTLLSLAYTPKKMSESDFSGFIAGILTRKGFIVQVGSYETFSTRRCV